MYIITYKIAYKIQTLTYNSDSILAVLSLHLAVLSHILQCFLASHNFFSMKKKTTFAQFIPCYSFI